MDSIKFKNTSVKLLIVVLLFFTACENIEQKEEVQVVIDEEKVSQEYKKVKEELKASGFEIEEEAKEIKKELKQSLHSGINDSSEL